ncbi:MAG: hypothetical protein HW401_542 [Parcubacteria group bacterium]|nr:hypothetical protein [Parcubacteria group bacterium]
MIIIYIIFTVLFIVNFIFYRKITRMLKYQNFKSNTILRLALQDDMEKFTSLEKATLNTKNDHPFSSPESNAEIRKRDEIVEKISKAIDDEIDNEPIWNWKELMTAIKSERFFQTELSEPFHRAFYPSEIIKRHKERNKEYIKNNK